MSYYALDYKTILMVSVTPRIVSINTENVTEFESWMKKKSLNLRKLPSHSHGIIVQYIVREEKDFELLTECNIMYSIFLDKKVGFI